MPNRHGVTLTHLEKAVALEPNDETVIFDQVEFPAALEVSQPFIDVRATVRCGARASLIVLSIYAGDPGAGGKLLASEPLSAGLADGAFVNVQARAMEVRPNVSRVHYTVTVTQRGGGGAGEVVTASCMAIMG